MSLTIFSREKGFFRQKIAIIIFISSITLRLEAAQNALVKSKDAKVKLKKNIVKFWTKISIKVTIFKQMYPKFLKAGRMRRQKSHWIGLFDNISANENEVS